MSSRGFQPRRLLSGAYSAGSARGRSATVVQNAGPNFHGFSGLRDGGRAPDRDDRLPAAFAPFFQVRPLGAERSIGSVPGVHPGSVRRPAEDLALQAGHQAVEVRGLCCPHRTAGEVGLDREDMNPGASAPGVLLFRSSSASREHLFDVTRPDHRVCAGDRVSEVCLVRCSLRIGVPEAGRCLDRPPVDESSGTSA